MTPPRPPSARPAGAGRVVPRTATVLLTLLMVPAVASDRVELDRMQQVYDGLNDLSASFRQTLHSGLLGPEEPERGRVLAARGGRMLWDYRGAERKTVVLDGTWAWIWLRDEGAVECYLLEDLVEEDVVGGLLSGAVNLRETFEVELLGEEDPGRLALRLRPHRRSEEFEEVRLTVDRDDLLPRRVVVEDPVGNRMEYVFDDVRSNRGLPGKAFRVKVPEETAWGEGCPPQRWLGP